MKIWIVEKEDNFWDEDVKKVQMIHAWTVRLRKQIYVTLAVALQVRVQFVNVLKDKNNK